MQDPFTLSLPDHRNRRKPQDCDNDSFVYEDESLDSEEGRSVQSSERQEFLVRGETAASITRVPSKRKPRPSVITSNNNQPAADALTGKLRKKIKQLEEENEKLAESNARLQEELNFVKEEKQSIEQAFARLDQEIGNGWTQKEREAKEIRIAQLTAKNQKLSEMLEKHTRSSDELRCANEKFQATEKKQQEQIQLLTNVVRALEEKQSALNDSNGSLMASYAKATCTIEKLQSELQELQAKCVRLQTTAPVSETVIDYAKRLEEWEMKYSEKERQQEQSQQLVVEKDHKIQQLNQVIKVLLLSKEALEKEIAWSHDQSIQLNVAIRTMEAKMEAQGSGGSHAMIEKKLAYKDDQLERMSRVIQELEAALTAKAEELRNLQQVHHLPSKQGVRKGAKKPPTRLRRPMSAHPTSRPATFSTNSIKDTSTSTSSADLSDKLRSVEESCKKKSRMVQVLVGNMTALLQSVDLLKEKLSAASESNEILARALDQMRRSTNERNEKTESKQDFLALARDAYVVAAPYDQDLMSDYFSPFINSESLSIKPRKKHFPPFRTRNVQLNSEQEAEDVSSLEILAEKSDTNGVSFLQRNKINLFLRVIQGKAMKNSFKELLVSKFAELLTKQRELTFQYTSELALHQSMVQLLQKENEELKRAIKKESKPCAPSSDTCDSGGSTHQLLFRLVDSASALAGVDRNLRRNSLHRTFITQNTRETSLAEADHPQTPKAVLNLCNCNISDRDLPVLYERMLEHGAGVFDEIDLEGNNLTDASAQVLATFLSQDPRIQVLNLKNTKFTATGAQILQNAIECNPRIEHVLWESQAELTLIGIAEDLDKKKIPIIRVYLPEEALSGDNMSNSDIEKILSRAKATIASVAGEKLVKPFEESTKMAPQQNAFSSFANDVTSLMMPSTLRKKSKVRPSSAPLYKYSEKSKASLRATVKEQKFRKLEAALARAEESESVRNYSDGEMYRSGLNQSDRALDDATRREIIKSITRRMRNPSASHRKSHIATIRDLKR